MGIIKKLSRSAKNNKAKEKKDLEQRIDAFHKAYKVLSLKHKIDISAEIDYKNIGIMATIKFVDLKARERAQAEAKAGKQPVLNRLMKEDIEDILKGDLRKTYKDKLDIRRVKALDGIIASRGVDKGKIMRDSGYSEAYAKNPRQFLNAKKTKSLLSWIDFELEEIAKRMDKTRNKAKYKELSDSFVNLKKLNQLIGGGATERLAITAEDKKQVDEAFEGI